MTNKDQIIKEIEKLVNIPSPTGFTHMAKEYLVDYAKERNINYTTTNKGSVIFTFGTNLSTKGLVCAAHVDALGAMVKEVKDNCVKLTTVGGYPALYIIGNYCTIHTSSGPVTGTILPDNPAAHVNSKLKELKPNFENTHVRLDLDFSDKEKKANESISVGDFVSFDPHFATGSGFVKSRHLDDKASAAVMLASCEEIQSREKDLKKPLHLFFNTTEETGQGIAGMPEIDELLIIDMGVVGDGCNGDEYNVSICAKDSSGPYNYEMTQALRKLAEENNIDHKMDVFPFYGSDGSAALRAGHDLKVALIGPGVSASHGYERTHEKALIATSDLYMKYIFN